MPKRVYATITISAGSATGWLRLVTNKRPVWELRYRLADGFASDKRLGKAWLEPGRPTDGFMTQAQAVSAAQTFLNERASVEPQEHETLHDACEAFLARKRRETRGSSIHGYISVARSLCARQWKHSAKRWGEQRMREILPRDVEELRTQMVGEHKSANTLNHYHHMIRGVFGAESLHARSWGRASTKRTGKSRNKIQFYNKDQVKRLKAQARNPIELAIFTLAIEEGARRSEIVALKRAAVDYKANKIRLEDGWTWGQYKENPDSNGFDGTKGNQVRSVPMTRNVGALLAPYVQGLPTHDGQGNELLVFSRDGQGRVPLDPDWISKRFIKARKRAGLPQITFHDLRHTFATNAMASGQVTLTELQEWLGHEEIATTQKYLHFAPNQDGHKTLSAIWDDDGEAEVIPLRQVG